MFRINLPNSDGYLLLMPQLGELPRWGQAFVLALAAGLLLFLIFRLYRYELQYVPKRYARSLLGLRLLIVGVVFTVAGLKPSIRHLTREVIPAHVLIAVDRSDSMSIADPQCEPAEKLELARGLKLAGDLADDATINGWIERLRKKERRASRAIAGSWSASTPCPAKPSPSACWRRTGSACSRRWANGTSSRLSASISNSASCPRTTSRFARSCSRTPRVRQSRRPISTCRCGMGWNCAMI